MSDTKKTKQQLIDELQTLRKKIEPNASAQPDPNEHALLGTVANISSIILSHTNLNDILDALTNEIIATNLFRSLTVMLVDNSAQNIQVVRSIHRDGQLNKDISILPLNTENIVGVVARTNQMAVIEGWDDRFAIDKSISQEQHIKGHENKVSYFTPIAQNKDVIAILATGSQKQEKQETLNRIEILRPIMGQLAVAIRYNQNDEQLQQQTRQLEAQVKTQQQDIEEKDQSLDAFQKIDQALLNTLDIDQLFDALIEHIVIQKYFRSLVISLVNYQKQTMQGVRNAFPSNEGIQHQSGELATYNLSDTQKVMPLVVKTGQLQIIDSPDDPRLDPPKPPFEPWKNKIAFFIPVKFEDQTLAVLATGCPPDQKDIILNRIRLLEPFLNHVAIALKHAQLHQESKEHALIQEINLKIRNTVQEMKQESDLHHVMHTCLIEIQKWKPDLCTLAIHRMVDQTQGIIESFRVDQNGPIKQSPTKNTRPSQMQEWFPEKNELTNQLQTLNTVLIDDLDKENPTTANAIRLRFNNHPIQSLIDIPFSRGILSIHSVLPKAFSVREETVFQNIIETLSTGLARIEDLVHLQDQNQKQNALLQINRTIQNMTQASDLTNVIHTIHDQLRHVQIQFLNFSIHHIINKDTGLIKAYRIVGTNEFYTSTGINKGTFADWKNGNTIYRPDTERNPQDLPKGYLESIHKKQGLRIRSMLNVPFKQGVMVLRSEQVTAFSQSEIRFIEQITDTLSIGISRAADLAQVQESEQHLRQTLSDVSIGIILANSDSEIIQANQAALTLLDLTEAQLLGKTALDPDWNVIDESGNILAQEDFPIPRAIKSKTPIQNIFMGVYRPKMKDRIDLLVSAQVQKDEAGDVKTVVCSFLDLTELRQTTRALQQSEDLLNEAQSIAHIGNWVFDIKTNHVTLSNELCKIYGLDPTEKSTTLNRVMELIHPDDKQMIQDRTRDYLETGTSGGGEFRMIRPGGDIVYLYGQSKAVYNSEGQITSLMGIVQDITESKQIQTERERTQRLRALGEMAAGISHNLNNILTGILGPAQMLQITNQDAQIGEDIDTILTAGLRARDIVSRLNQGWRTDTETLESTDLNQAIQEAVQATRPRWKDAPETKGIHIQINQHLAEIPPLQGTQSGLYDIIINLIFNAVDAMPNGGRISLTTLQTQDCVRLLFSDTGTGMSKATQRRIFDPFFTTKEQIGTGLGLSTVYGTITRWNGSIDVASTQGQGTTFTLDFAIWEKDQIEYATPTTTKSDQVGRILIVEAVISG